MFRVSVLFAPRKVKKHPLRGVWKASKLKHIRSNGIERSMDKLFGVQKRDNPLRRYPERKKS